MNLSTAIVGASRFLVPPACFAAGCALNGVSLALNRLAVKYLRLPIDIHNQKSLKEFRDNAIAYYQTKSDFSGVGLDRELGATLADWVVGAVREEISYRYLLERVVLSNLGVSPFARTCISTTLFAASHLHNPATRNARAGQFIHTAVLGVICSLAQRRFGLIAPIFIHVGYNFYGWQYGLNRNWSDVLKNIKAIYLIDIIHYRKILAFLVRFPLDVVAPFILLINTVIKIKSCLVKKALPQNVA